MFGKKTTVDSCDSLFYDALHPRYENFFGNFSLGSCALALLLTSQASRPALSPPARSTLGASDLDAVP